MFSKLSSVAVFACVVSAAGLIGCGGADDSRGAPVDPGTGTKTAPLTVHDDGVVADYLSAKALPGITISEGGLSTTTDAAGKWSLAVPVGVPMSPVFTGPNYTKIIFAERMLNADFNETTGVPDLDLFRLGTGGLVGYDSTRGSVNVVVQPTGKCTNVAGGTVTVKSPADAKVMYYAGLLPDSTATSFGAPTGMNPVAVVYNVPAGATVDLEISHPTCTQVPFPATAGGATYTGKVDIEVGDVSSVAFYFLN